MVARAISLSLLTIIHNPEDPEVEILLSRIWESRSLLSRIWERRRVIPNLAKRYLFFFFTVKNLLSWIRESRSLLSRNFGKVKLLSQSTIILDIPGKHGKIR